MAVIVEEFAVGQLLDAVNYKKHEKRPHQLQLAKNIADKFAFEPTSNVNITIDACPSDALNMAERFKAPIYVSKEIVRKDAIKIVHGKWKGKGKVVYDVTLDSAIEGHDPCTLEIHLLLKMNTAVINGRYKDAAVYRDTIAKLRWNI